MIRISFAFAGIHNFMNRPSNSANLLLICVRNKISASWSSVNPLSSKPKLTLIQISSILSSKAMTCSCRPFIMDSFLCNAFFATLNLFVELTPSELTGYCVLICFYFPRYIWLLLIPLNPLILFDKLERFS